MIVNYTEEATQTITTVTITAKPNDPQAARLMAFIGSDDARLSVRKETEIYLLDKVAIYYIETVDNAVFIYTEHDVYETDLRLYELEHSLSFDFIRISKSIIVNLMAIRSIEPSVGSRLILKMKNQEQIQVNRSYVKQFKEKLKIR